MNEAAMVALEDKLTAMATSCDDTSSVIKESHFKCALEKVSPSVSNEVHLILWHEIILDYKLRHLWLYAKSYIGLLLYCFYFFLFFLGRMQQIKYYQELSKHFRAAWKPWWREKVARNIFWISMFLLVNIHEYSSAGANRVESGSRKSLIFSLLFFCFIILATQFFALSNMLS